MNLDKKGLTISPVEPDLPFVPVMGRLSFLKARSAECGYITDGSHWLPYFIERKGVIFRYIVFSNLPFPSAAGDETAGFFATCVDFVKERRLCDFIFQPLSHVVAPSEIPGTISRSWATPVVDLDRNSEDRLDSFHPKHRYEIRKASRQSHSFAELDPVQFRSLLASNEDGNPNYTYPSLERIKSLLAGLAGNAAIHGLISQGVAVAGALILHDERSAYYIYGGSQKGSIGWMHLLQREIMDLYQAMGIPKYDLVGYRPPQGEDEKYAGLARFKSRFNPDLVKGFTFWAPVKPLKVMLFKLALTMRKLITGKEFYF